MPLLTTPAAAWRRGGVTAWRRDGDTLPPICHAQLESFI